MKAKKTKQAATKKRAKPGKSSEKRISDQELRKLQKELTESRNKSILIEADIRKLRDKLNFSSLGGKPGFDRDFIFKCGKCVGEFSHKARITPIDHKVICPKCNKEHIVQIKPILGDYKVKLPKGIKLVDRK